jgi:hypothetical protein
MRCWSFVVVLVVCSLGCSSVSDKEVVAPIEEALALRETMNFVLGDVTIRSPLDSAFNGNEIDRPVFKFEFLSWLKKAEAAGLLNLTETTSQNSLIQIGEMGARHFRVTATPKLMELAKVEPKVGPDGQASTLPVLLTTAKVENIVTNAEYKGQLATPGETFRTVLGTAKTMPTDAMRAMPQMFDSPPAETRYRFRAILKFDQFKKAWVRVALDLGGIDDDNWFTSNVK